MATDKGKVERVRVLLEELADTFTAMEREIDQRWKTSTPADGVAREQAYQDWRALQRVQRLLTNVLRADELEHPNG